MANPNPFTGEGYDTLTPEQLDDLAQRTIGAVSGFSTQQQVVDMLQNLGPMGQRAFEKLPKKLSTAIKNYANGEPIEGQPATGETVFFGQDGNGNNVFFDGYGFVDSSGASVGLPQA